MNYTMTNYSLIDSAEAITKAIYKSTIRYEEDFFDVTDERYDDAVFQLSFTLVAATRDADFIKAVEATYNQQISKLSTVFSQRSECPVVYIEMEEGLGHTYFKWYTQLFAFANATINGVQE